jgi:hypothetical protein
LSLVLCELCLLAIALGQVTISVLGGFFLMVGVSLDPTFAHPVMGWVVGGGLAMVLIVLSVLLALLFAIAMIGIALRTKWGWWLALVLAGLYLPGLPLISLPLLVVLVRLGPPHGD